MLRASVVLSILGAATLQAATLQLTTVDDTLAGPACSLRAAILAADADAPVGGCPPGDPGLDTIELPAGVFTLDLPDAPPPETCGPGGDEPCPPEDEDLGATGDLDVQGPVEMVGAGRAATIIQSPAGLGGAPARVLEILDGGTATLRDLTIRNGRSLPGEPGAGIAVGPGASLDLTGCLVAENETDGSGGGVYAGPGSSVTLERCELRDNVGFGGGLFGLAASVTLRISLVAGNRATASGGGGGLALVAGEATVETSEIADNLADDSRWGGGGILALGGRVTVRASTLAGNSATDALDDGSVSNPELDETGGGGLAAFSAEVWLENSTISGNRADESRWGGGGMLSLFSDVRIAHSTFRDNRSDLAVPPGGSLSALGPGDALGSFTLAHSILAAASPAECGALFPPPVPAPDGTANLVADASCGPSIDSLGPVTGLDPLLADNGGPTRTHALAVGSNAIDAAPTPCAVALDQRGVARPQGAACDLGAVEQAAPTTLTVAGAGGGTGTVADANPGGTIACTSTAGVESGDCSEQTATGTVFAVVATPAAGSELGGWSGCDSTSTTSLPDDTCQVTLDADRTVTAAFDQVVQAPASLTATKSVSGDFMPGGAITYTVVLTNTGTAAQPDNPGDEFVDVLPPGLALVSAASTGGTTVADTGTNTVTFNGEIAGGASVTIAIDATITAQEGSISNQGAAFFDAEGDGTNETEVLTDDPTTAAPDDATVFLLAGAQDIPTLSTVALMILAGLLAGAAMKTMRS